MPLCQYCSRLAPDWLIPDIYDKRGSEKPKGNTTPEHRWTHSSWAELLEAAKSCELCSLIVRESKASEDWEPYWKPDRKGIRIQSIGLTRLEVVCAEEHRVAKLRYGFDAGECSRLFPEKGAWSSAYSSLVSVGEAERAPQDAQDLIDPRMPDTCSGGAQNIRAISRWISVCGSSHPKCSTWSSGKNTRHMPTRILDVANDTIRLHMPSDLDRDDYIALSYCWGNGNPYKTTKSNLADHSKGIPVSVLPPALQDVVKLTRTLNFRYLWIDALCIIQDDRDDWLREASKMKAVYSQAFLTISTDLLADTTTRFLGLKRSDRHELRVALPWTRAPPSDKKVQDGQGIDSPDETPMQHLSLDSDPENIYVLPTLRTFKDEIKMSPLARRGWTFQERALSARILHMGSESSYWECKEACNGEDSKIGHYSIQDSFFNLKDMMLTTDAHGNEMTNLKLHAKWAWVIKEFSDRALTNEGDLFPALEGVAALFSEKNMLGKYFCGIWEDDFLRGLLWMSDRQNSPLKQHRRCPSYRAPSWSWASVCGPVQNAALETAFVRAPDGGIQSKPQPKQ